MTRVYSINGWSFVATDRRLGSWRPQRSPNTFEVYVVKTTGSWVPTIDVEWLVSFKKRCPCANNAQIQVMSIVRSTIDDIKSRPKHSPRLREKASPVFGLSKV